MTARRRFFAHPSQLDLFDPALWASIAAKEARARRLQQHSRHAAIRARINAPRVIAPAVDPVVVILDDHRRRSAPEPKWPAIVDTRITVGLVLEATCEAFAADGLRVMPRDVLKGDRLPEVIRVRHVSMFLVRDLVGMKMPEIGRRFGGMDHTSVMHAVRKIRGLSQDPGFAGRLDEVREAIRIRAGRGNADRSP